MSLQVGHPGIRAILQLQGGAHVIHRGLGPAAVEAQHGNGVGDPLLSFLGGHRRRINEAFHISAPLGEAVSRYSFTAWGRVMVTST